MLACVALTSPAPAATARATARALMNQAVESARFALETQAIVRAPEDRVPMVIVRKDSGLLVVHSADAWRAPTAPTGEPVATVSLDGTVTHH